MSPKEEFKTNVKVKDFYLLICCRDLGSNASTLNYYRVFTVVPLYLVQFLREWKDRVKGEGTSAHVMKRETHPRIVISNRPHLIALCCKCAECFSFRDFSFVNVFMICRTFSQLWVRLCSTLKCLMTCPLSHRRLLLLSSLLISFGFFWQIIPLIINP